MPRLRVTVAAALLLAGCGDSAGPAEFDAVQLGDDVSAIVTTVESTPTTYLDMAGFQMRRFFSGPGLPDSVKGKTYVRGADPGLGDYVASTRTGAPAGGVRFVLYDVNVLPSVETGHVDLTDAGSASRRAVRVRAFTSAGQVFADYEATMTGTLPDGTYELAGYLLNGTSRTEFELSGEIVPGARAGGSYGGRIELLGRELQLESRMTFPTTFTDPIQISVAVNGQGGELELDGEELNGALSAGVSVNGTAYATLQSQGGGPVTVTPAGDLVLTADQENLFRSVRGMTEISLRVARFLVDPVATLIAPVPVIP